jgi:hypothetical protein
MKTLTHCRCNRRHRSTRTFLQCALDPLWIHGEGEFASVSTCRGRTTVMLYSTAQEAEAGKAQIDGSACGGFCERNRRPGCHYVAWMGSPSQRAC